jgi:hypothetical protein
MLAPVPCFPIEQHDTDVDAASGGRVRIRPRIAELRADLGAERSAAMPRKVLHAGSPVTPEEAMKKGSLSRLRVREALVKVQHSFKEEAKERERAKLPPPKIVVPEVRIAWVRSTDRAQRLIRYGADGFVVEGAADGGPAMVRTCVKSPTLSLGIDGLIFSVAVSAGDLADRTLERLIARLDQFYRVEITERRETLSAARIISSR